MPSLLITFASFRRGGLGKSAQSRKTGTRKRSGLSGDQLLPLAAEAADLQLHDVPCPEVRETAGQGDSLWGAGVDDVAGAEHHELRKVLDQGSNGEDHVGGV